LKGVIDKTMLDAKTHKYVVSKPFDTAIKMVRHTLTVRGLSIATELDLSERINRELAVKLAACRVLFVDTPINLLESTMLDVAAATYLPFHVVIIARGQFTDVYILNREAITTIDSPLGVNNVLTRLHAQISEALDLLNDTRIEQAHPITAHGLSPNPN
jgi:uncharacterized protein (DUF302 family)